MCADLFRPSPASVAMAKRNACGFAVSCELQDISDILQKLKINTRTYFRNEFMNDCFIWSLMDCPLTCVPFSCSTILEATMSHDNKSTR